MTQSMSRVAHCIDNGPMEGFWGILKGERYYGKRFYSKKALVDMIENFIRYYNTRRVQRKLGVLTPILSRKPLCCIRAPCPVRSKNKDRVLTHAVTHELPLWVK